jgi:hypothetical protein
MLHPVIDVQASDVAQGESYPLNGAPHDFSPLVGEMVEPEFSQKFIALGTHASEYFGRVSPQASSIRPVGWCSYCGVGSCRWISATTSSTPSLHQSLSFVSMDLDD